MKIIRYPGLALLAAALLSSCFGIKDENYPQLSPIKIVAASDTLNANIGEPFVYTGLKVESDSEIRSWEWAYGLPATGSRIADHKFQSIEKISDSPTIDYAFRRTGSYILRLRVDNGESIAFKYFTLNVNSGFDEGIVVLSNDASQNSSLTFIKTLTSEEKARGDERVMDMSTFGAFSHGRALFMSDFTDTGVQDAEGNNMQFAGLIIATDDADGTLYHVEPKSMELNTKLGLKGVIGTGCAEFAGEYSRVHAFSLYFIGDDGYMYMYDMEAGGSASRIEEVGKVERGYPMVTAETPGLTRYPAFFSSKTAGIRRSSSNGARFHTEEGWSVVNMGVSRSSYSYIYILLSSDNVPGRYKIVSETYSTFGRGSWNELLTFDNPGLKMDRKSKVLGVKASSDLYYTYDNAIWRWGLSSQPSLSPAITLPDGEQLRDICTNLYGKTGSSDGEDKLIVASYNPSRSGKKGSVFIYDVLTQQLEEKFEGICDDPASVIYKYRLN